MSTNHTITEADRQEAFAALREHYGVLIENGIAVAFDPRLNDLIYFYFLGKQAAYESAAKACDAKAAQAEENAAYQQRDGAEDCADYIRDLAKK